MRLEDGTIRFKRTHFIFVKVYLLVINQQDY